MDHPRCLSLQGEHGLEWWQGEARVITSLGQQGQRPRGSLSLAGRAALIFCTLGLPGSPCESFCDNKHCSAQGLQNWDGREGGGEEKEPSSAELHLCSGRENRERGKSPTGSWGLPPPHTKHGFCPGGSLGYRTGVEAGDCSDTIQSSLSCWDAPAFPPRGVDKGSSKGSPPQEIPGPVLYVFIPLEISPKTPGLDCKMQYSLYRNNE